MDESRQQRAIDSLKEWSQWLIGVDFMAATGCMVVLERGAQGLMRFFLMLAIAAFVLSILSSVFLIKTLAALVEELPLRDEAGHLTSIYNFPAGLGMTVRELAQSQVTLFLVAAAFLLFWLMLK